MTGGESRQQGIVNSVFRRQTIWTYLKRYVSTIIWRVVTDIGKKLMKIASYNLGAASALNIGTCVLRRHTSAFTGFSPFLLSRGSMAAPTAK
jgi:hypothetical protein